MKIIRRLSFYAMLLFVGIAMGGAAAFYFLDARFPSHWFVLAKTADTVRYSNEAFTDSDIPVPDITSVSGKAKFLSDSAWPSERGVPLGYMVSVRVKPIDVSKLPEKYRKEKVIQTKAGPMTEMPLEQPTYELHFDFQLIDPDGFQIFTITSPKHTMRSGETTELQSQTDTLVSAQVAAHANKVVVHLMVDKCLSATSE